MVPDGWSRAVLSEGIDLISGRHIQASDCNFDGLGMPYLTGPEDFSNGSIRVTKFVSNPDAVCDPGDILLVVKGSGTGKMMRADARYCISRQLMAIRSLDWSDCFLEHVIRAGEKRFGSAASGLIPGITRLDILETPILVPPLPEQQKIAAILSTWDRAIELTEKLIAAKQKRKQALMQQLLTGKVRFCSGMRCDGWTMKRLKDVAPLQRGFDLTKENLRKGRVPVISSSGLWGFHDEAKVDGPGIVIGRYGTLGEVFFVEEAFWPHNTTLWVTDFCGNDPQFLDYLYRSIDISKHSGKTGVPGLNRNDLHLLKVHVPPLAEQHRIAAVLSSADHEIELLQRKVETIRSQKKGLMQRLLTGKVRVNVDAETVKG